MEYYYGEGFEGEKLVLNVVIDRGGSYGRLVWDGFYCVEVELDDVRGIGY